MDEFVRFLGFVNLQLNGNDIPRLEMMLMPATFSSLVGEFMATSIPKYCVTLVKNTYHNGHPDLIPSSRFPRDAVQYSHEGVEIKASRYARGWQGHNPEDSWLMVYVFDSNRPADPRNGIPPRPFRFVQVLGAQLAIGDWTAAGRSGTSRRTPTAAVNDAGFRKMMSNRIYQIPATSIGATAPPPPLDPPAGHMIP